jgi:hypothetical protein
MPRGDRRLGEPHRQIAPAAQTFLILRPVRQPTLLLRNMVAALGVGLERHGGIQIRVGARLLPQPAPMPNAGYPVPCTIRGRPRPGKGKMSGLFLARGRMPSSVRPLMRQRAVAACMGVRRPGPYQRRVLDARWCILALPIPSHRPLRHNPPSARPTPSQP